MSPDECILRSHTLPMFPLYRLAATLTNPSSEALIEQYFTSFNDKQPHVQDESELSDRPDALTGACMVVNHTAALLLLEGPESVLREVIQDATIMGGEDAINSPPSMSNTGSTAVLSPEDEHQTHTSFKLGSPPPNATNVIKICSYSEDVPREFNTLSFRQARATVEDVTCKSSTLGSPNYRGNVFSLMNVHL